MKHALTLPLLLFCATLLHAQSIDLSLTLVSDEFSSPLNLQHAGDDRLFVVEQGGLIRILNNDGSVNAVPFLDLSGQISVGGERGLLGLAFHPDYDTNGFFYVNYTDTAGDTQVSRFSVSTGDPDVADPGSELPILGFDQPQSNHNGGCLAFGPDGYLYISSGDGGGGGDTNNRAQNTELLLGKMLRIDIDTPSGGENYSIPADNPFAGDPSKAEEIWAYGLRNPWKFSFDADTGDIWIGDVGQGDVEEIDRAGSTEAGLNYGWRCYEGSDPFNTSGCPDPSELTFPIAEYSSSTGSGNQAVTGGYVYRGDTYPAMEGLYFFADLTGGFIGTVDDSGTLTEYDGFPGFWVSFGEDVNNELYIIDLNGGVYQMEATFGVEDVVNTSVALYPNPTSDRVTLSVSQGVMERVVITGVQGNRMMERSDISSEEITVTTASLATGIYFVRVTLDSGASIVKKLVVR
ncbi:PQQ-dependent sugar dehydrogenase [Altibacter sp. HG106]|uniref:PQQ-dependent sugar dehydrogenase n=1 Tax=Altibacter sp. HG106 TaxID=3023937 RepID=UPI0023504DB5|nr:PQQ-dependent sugar dehydrogenase [Altibacter sp. HG106]MDC7995601.1 PQQ-dependent sugar dehydrogenase [Altibacter sp. HG106]